MIVIFDLDGTLVKTTQLHCDTFMEALNEKGIDASEEEVKNLIGLSGIDMARELGAKNPQEVFARKVDLFMKRINQVQEIEGASKTLEVLKAKGHTLCLATAANREMTLAIVEKFGWDFHHVVTADDVSESKPSPESLKKAMEGLEGSAVFVGDSRYDREMAERYGMPALILGDDINKIQEVPNKIINFEEDQARDI